MTPTSRLIALLALAVAPTLAADAASWRSRSIYQLLTDRFARTDGSTTATCDTGDQIYCGGSWAGITAQLDYIQGMGFDAVWISPITAQTSATQNTADGTSYHGYWQTDLYSLNTNFGTASDLQNLASALHQRGMYLMVDIVVNHNGWIGAENTVDYSSFHPFDEQSYYHSYCPITDYNNQTQKELCWLGDNTVPLVDLATENPTVASEYQQWVTQLVSNYSIDGLRVDTVMYVDMDFWQPFQSAAGVFITGEVDDSDPSYVCSYQNVIDSTLSYPVFDSLIPAFQSTSGNIGNLANTINSVKSDCKDSTVLGSFSENHDNPRFPSYTQDMSLAQNVIAFSLLADGVPIIYAGQEQHYAGGATPSNREATWLSGYNTQAPLYTHVAKLNQIRARAIAQNDTYLTYQNYPVYTDTSTLAMRKGFDGNQIIAVLSNLGAQGANYTLQLGNTGYDAGSAVVDILACQDATVDGSGVLPVEMGQGLPRVFYPQAQLKGSGICGN